MPLAGVSVPQFFQRNLTNNCEARDSCRSQQQNSEMGKSTLAQLTEGLQGHCQGALLAQLALRCLYSGSRIVKFRCAARLNMAVFTQLQVSIPHISLSWASLGMSSLVNIALNRPPKSPNRKECLFKEQALATFSQFPKPLGINADLSLGKTRVEQVVIY